MEYRLRDRPIVVLAVILEWPGRDREEDLQVRRYYPDPDAPRGYEIKVWLTRHPEIEHYAILDDAGGILPEQRANFFKRHGKVV
jgi:hypothetical protein